MERRLTAILAADVAGYSRMIGTNEEGTLLDLRWLRDTLIDPKIAEHHGRIVKLMGDGILAEFSSVVDAVACADLAEAAGMSASSFHEHFKSITATTPLRYQKDLRLLEARRLLSAGDHSVSSTAFAIGYESPTQFSREYTRKFGASPRNDLSRAVVAV